jgi:hypothetical protein
MKNRMKKFKDFINESAHPYWASFFKWEYKPAEWEDVNKTVNYEPFKNYLDKLIVFDTPRSYKPMDYFELDPDNKKLINKHDELDPYDRKLADHINIFIIRIKNFDSDDYYLIDPSGFNYCRFAVKLENFNDSNKIVENNNNKIEIKPGGTYTVDEFNSSIKTTSKGGDKQKFLKDNGDGYYSSDAKKNISAEDVKKLIEIVGDKEGIYKFFILSFYTFDIKIEEVGQDKEDVKSNNIYDLMHAKTITHYKGSFKVKIKYNDPPIEVSRDFSKNTTLGWREINSFL